VRTRGSSRGSHGNLYPQGLSNTDRSGKAAAAGSPAREPQSKFHTKSGLRRTAGRGSRKKTGCKKAGCGKASAENGGRGTNRNLVKTQADACGFSPRPCCRIALAARRESGSLIEALLSSDV